MHQQPMIRNQTLIDKRQLLPGGLHELVSACEVEGGEEERALTARKHAIPIPHEIVRKESILQLRFRI
jgi:hypothetical protein